MHEILELIKNESFYHPHILCLIGHVFINSNPTEPVLTDEVCLEELGAYLINRLIQQPYKIPDETIKCIAYAKRWDTTDRKTLTINKFKRKSSRDFQNIIDSRLNGTIAMSSLGIMIRDLLLTVFELAPQYHHEIESIKTKVNEGDLLEGLHYLIDRLDSLDRTLKQEDLLQHFHTANNPHLKCTLQILITINNSKGLGQDSINTAITNFLSSTDEDINSYNILTIKQLDDFIINQLNENGFVESLTANPQNLEKIKNYVNQTFLNFWRNASAVNEDDIHGLLSYINVMVNNIEYDYTVLNYTYEMLNDLISALKSNPLNTVSAELVAGLQQSCKMVVEIKSSLEKHNSALGEIIESVKRLETVLPQRTSKLYCELQQKFLIFDQRFAVPPHKIFEKLNELHTVYTQVTSSVISIKDFINGLDYSDKKQVSFNLNYLGHHTAYSLLAEIRLHISNLNDKADKFNIEKDKCYAFETTLEALQRSIYDDEDDDVPEIVPIKSVFVYALQSYKLLWQPHLKCLYTTNVVTAIRELKIELQELENILSKIVEQRERMLQTYAATPAAKIKMLANRDNNALTSPAKFSTHARRQLLRVFNSSVDDRQNKQPRLKTEASKVDTDASNKENNLVLRS